MFFHPLPCGMPEPAMPVWALVVFLAFAGVVTILVAIGVFYDQLDRLFDRMKWGSRHE